MKKGLSFLLAATLTVSLLSGCGAEEKQSAAGSVSESAPVPAATVAETAAPTSADTGIAETAAPTSADTGANTDSADEPLVMDAVGITLPFPDEFQGEHGFIALFFAGEYGFHSGVYILQLGYNDIRYDRYSLLIEKEQTDGLTEEETSELEIIHDVCFPAVLAIDGGREFPELFRVAELEYRRSDAVELTKVGEYTFYRCEPTRTGVEDLKGEYAEEFARLRESFLQTLERSEFYEPTPTEYTSAAGTLLSFETVDVDGNPVTSAELFSAHQLTLLNIWASWCGPCQREMPDLAQLHDRLAEIDCGVVGLLGDPSDSEALDYVKELMANAGVTYPVIQCPEDFRNQFTWAGWPTTVFVNRDGVIVGDTVLGLPGEEPGEIYERLMRSLLTDEQESGPSQTAVSPNSAAVYRVYVVDAAGKPVEGATVQFCSDDMCLFADTDAEGLVIFDADKGLYTVHMLKVPEGYLLNETEFTTLKDHCDIRITLEKE